MIHYTQNKQKHYIHLSHIYISERLYVIYIYIYKQLYIIQQKQTERNIIQDEN